MRLEWQCQGGGAAAAKLVLALALRFLVVRKEGKEGSSREGFSGSVMALYRQLAMCTVVRSAWAWATCATRDGLDNVLGWVMLDRRLERRRVIAPPCMAATWCRLPENFDAEIEEERKGDSTGRKKGDCKADLTEQV